MQKIKRRDFLITLSGLLVYDAFAAPLVTTYSNISYYLKSANKLFTQI